jgi:hypothetical protein
MVDTLLAAGLVHGGVDRLNIDTLVDVLTSFTVSH